MAADAAEEERAVKLEHDRRCAAAIALLNRHNPDWFASEVGNTNNEDAPSTSRGGSGDKGPGPGHQKAMSSVGVGGATGDAKQDAAAAVAKQRALAMALLNEHNSDWLGQLDPTSASGSGSRKQSLCESKSATLAITLSGRPFSGCAGAPISCVYGSSARRSLLCS